MTSKDVRGGLFTDFRVDGSPPRRFELIDLALHAVRDELLVRPGNRTREIPRLFHGHSLGQQSDAAQL
ncbi:hypothetical protein AR457_41575 [Streptomyces agglomeratus]|nr:hypothetical protein AR457_41575 [Streptomyces agglomeratus]